LRRRNHTHSLDDGGWLLECLGDDHSLESGLGDDGGLCDDCRLDLRDSLSLGLGLHHLRFDGSACNSGRDWLGLGLPNTYQLWIDSQKSMMTYNRDSGKFGGRDRGGGGPYGREGALRCGCAGSGVGSRGEGQGLDGF